MIDLGKKNVLGVLVDAVDHEAAVARTIAAATERKPYGVTALAVHGLMTGRNPVQRGVLNGLDLVTPDGQPVRWALNVLYRTGLQETVRGTDLTLGLIAAAEREHLPVFFYGSRQDVLEALQLNVREQFPQLVIAGVEPSKFRLVGAAEQGEIVERIKASGARLVFVGLGCPRQETFAHALHDELSMPLVAVGAAFDYLAGSLRQPPRRVQRSGLEWLWRLALEPRRLWRRYVLLNPLYMLLLTAQALRVWTPSTAAEQPPAGDLAA